MMAHGQQVLCCQTASLKLAAGLCVYILGKSPSYNALFLWLALKVSAIGRSD